MGNLRAKSSEKPTIRVLADSDVILELFINREKFVEDAEMLFKQIQQSRFLEVYITDKCLKRIRLEDELGEDVASRIESIFDGRIITIDRSIRESARESCLRDYDSAEEVACVKTKLLDAIVTQNPRNFEGEDLQVWSVHSLHRRLYLETNLLLEPKSKLETGFYHLTSNSQIQTNLQLANNNLWRQFAKPVEKNTLAILLLFYRLRLRQVGLAGKHEPDDILNHAILRLSHTVHSGRNVHNVTAWLRTTGFLIILELRR